MGKSTDLTTSPKPLPTAPKNIPIEDLIDLRQRGLSCAQIAKIVGCDKSNVARRLANLDGLNRYKKHRGDVFADLQRRLICSIGDADIKRMAPDRRIWGAAVLYDKERLERGQSTENISVYGAIQEISRGLAEARRKLAELGEDDEN